MLQNASRKMRPGPGSKRFYEAEGFRADGTYLMVELLEGSNDDSDWLRDDFRCARVRVLSFAYHNILQAQ
jgi:hypothetical protein